MNPKYKDLTLGMFQTQLINSGRDVSVKVCDFMPNIALALPAVDGGRTQNMPRDHKTCQTFHYPYL